MQSVETGVMSVRRCGILEWDVTLMESVIRERRARDHEGLWQGGVESMMETVQQRYIVWET
jgi:hypothetical protein